MVRACADFGVQVLVVGVSAKPRIKGYVGAYKRVEVKAREVAQKYGQRDQWMIDRAAICMFVWNGESNGTKAGYDYAMQQGKDAHLRTFNGVK